MCLVILIGTGSVDRFGKGDRPLDVLLSHQIIKLWHT